MTLISTLNTERLRLVLPAERHVPAHAAWCASARADARGWKQPAHLAWREFAAVAGHHALKGWGPYVAELRDDETGTGIGLFGLWQPPAVPEIELKWTIWNKDHEGKGLALEAVRAVRDHARRVQGVDAPVSYIHAPNPRSEALARRLGAVRDGDWTTPTGKIVGRWRHPASGTLETAGAA